MLPTVTEEELSDLYAWVDSVPLSRPKKSIARDFSDAVCVAEIIHHYFPRIIELHNYSPASNSSQKMYNWTTLNTRTFKKLGFTLSKEDMEGAVFARPTAIEQILKLLRSKLAQYQAKHGQERAAQIQLLATTATPLISGTFPSPDGVHGIFSRGAAADQILGSRAAVDPAAGGRGLGLGGGGVSKVLDYNGTSEYLYNENAGGNIGQQGGLGGGFIPSFRGGGGGGEIAMVTAAGLAAEVEDLRALNEVLEVKTAKLEQLLRLKDAKIAALTARLQKAGLLSPPPPPQAARGGVDLRADF